MVTSEIFEKLKELQDILVQKYDLEAKVEEAPKQLTTQEELLARLKKEYIAKHADYEQIKTTAGSLKLELDEAVKSRENGEKGMDNITTHREYEALEKQINEATEKEAELRKELQKTEKNLAELDETLKGYESMITAQESDLTTSKESLDNQITGYKEKLNHLKAEEDKITPDLDQEILFKFERIIQRNSEGIVAVKNGVCTGCHMILPAQFANTVREGENILFCPYCSRILYHEDAEEGAESYFNFDEAGSLVGFDLDDDDEESDDELDEDYDEDGDSSEYDEDSENEDDELDDETEDDEESDEDDSDN